MSANYEDRQRGGGYDNDDDQDRRPMGGRGGGRRMHRRRVCRFCIDKVDLIDFKDVRLLQNYLPERGKILPRRISGNCATHQRMLAEALRERGYEIDRHRIHLREPLKRLGDYTVPVRLHREVTMDLKIRVAPEGEVIVGHLSPEQEAELAKQAKANEEETAAD